MKNIFASVAIALTAVCGAAAPAGAQSGRTMLAPGIYTTPEISLRCQNYTRSRVSNSGAADSERQSVFLACVQKLGSGVSVGPAPVTPVPVMNEVAVSLPTDGYGDGSGYGYTSGFGACSTDEGYGRRGSCDNF